MTGREKTTWFTSLGIAVLIGALATQYLLTVVFAKPITLQVFFDGGYTFDFSGADAVNVNELTKAGYPMKVKLVTTTGSPIVDVTGYTLRLLPDGAVPSPKKPGLPPEDGTRTGCEMDDQVNANNRLFIPNLADVATRMGTTIKSSLDKAAVFALTGGGTFSVHHVGGCVEYHDAMNNPISDLPKRSMASGVGGVLFEWLNIAKTKVVLERTPLGGGTPLLIEALPNTSNKIVLWVSSFGPPSSTAGTPHVITHFKDHYDDVFTTIDETKRISLYWLGTYLVSPGIDCPGGGF